MKLFLASSDLTPSLVSSLKSLAIPGRHNKKPVVVAIYNACDYKGESFQEDKHAEIYKLLEFASKIEKLDLRQLNKYFSRYINLIKEADMLFVSGGNSFYLLYWMIRSGFSDVLKEELDKDLVYCGTSAGAIVLSDKISALEVMDDPSVVPEKFDRGLGVLDFTFVPHANNPSYNPQKAIERLRGENVKYIAVDENEALSIIDYQIKQVK